MATTECKDILIAIIISANIQKYIENKQIFIFFVLFIVVTKKCTRIISYNNEIISSAREVEKIDKRIHASVGIKGLIQAMYIQHSYDSIILCNLSKKYDSKNAKRSKILNTENVKGRIHRIGRSANYK